MSTHTDLQPEPSLCVDCARHPSLKRVIEADSKIGLCALCGQTDAPVRNTNNAEPMIMLIRSLVRYYYDEYEYNPHWGGDSIFELLSEPRNPILGPAKTDNYIDDFEELLMWPPYPEYDKGVSIYAGFTADGIRGVLFAISKTTPKEIQKLQLRLLNENFFDVEPSIESLIAPALKEIEVALPADDIWFRARMGYQQRYRRSTLSWHDNVQYQPWMHRNIGAPPPLNAGFGRLNRAGVAMLYLASNKETAIAEIRPHPGHYVSIGAFKNREVVRLANFDPDIANFSANDERLHLYSIIQAFDRMMSTPVTPEEKSSYLLTQLVAEILLRRGFGGVTYRSSVANGNNICIFRPSIFEFIADHSEVRQIKAVQYDAPPVLTLIHPTEEDHPLPK